MSRIILPLDNMSKTEIECIVESLQDARGEEALWGLSKWRN